MKFSTKNGSYLLIQYAASIFFLKVASGSAENLLVAGNDEPLTPISTSISIINILAAYKLDVPMDEKIFEIGKMSHGNFGTASAPLSASERRALKRRNIGVFKVNGINENEIICPVEGTHTYPHPDCTKFIHCVNGEQIVLECPEPQIPLYYNPIKRECDFPFNVPECVGGTRPTGEPSTTTTTEPEPPISTTEWTFSSIEWASTTTDRTPTYTEWASTTTEWIPTYTEWASTTTEWTPTYTDWTSTTTEWTPTNTEWTPTFTESPTTTTDWTPTSTEDRTTITTAEPTTSTTAPTWPTTTTPTTTTDRDATGHPLPSCPPYEIGKPPVFFPGTWCDNYYMCTENSPILMQCARPLWWNQNIKTCTMPWSTTCSM